MVPNNCNQIIWYGTQKTLVVKYLPNDLVRGTKYLVTVTKLFLRCARLDGRDQICTVSKESSVPMRNKLQPIFSATFGCKAEIGRTSSSLPTSAKPRCRGKDNLVASTCRPSSSPNYTTQAPRDDCTAQNPMPSTISVVP